MSWKRSSSRGDGQQPRLNFKKPRSSDSDVVVVVGGKVFTENVHVLRSASDYFDSAFASGMRESQTKRFEFPNKNPKEWELVSNLLKPFSGETVKATNLRIVLPWFDEFCIQEGLNQCDRLLCQKILPENLPLAIEKKEPNRKARYSQLRVILGYFDLSVKYNLKDAQKRCLQKILDYFERFPFNLSERLIEQIPSFLAAADDKVRGKFWMFVERFLGTKLTYSDNERDELLSNPLFPNLLWSRISLDSKSNQVKTIANVINSHRNGYDDLADLKKELKKKVPEWPAAQKPRVGRWTRPMYV